MRRKTCLRFEWEHGSSSCGIGSAVFKTGWWQQTDVSTDLFFFLRHGRVLLTGLLPIACSTCFLHVLNEDLFILYTYAVAVFRHPSRGRQIPLQIVVRHHVVAGIWTQETWRIRQCSKPLSHLSSPSADFLTWLSDLLSDWTISI